MSTAGSGDGLGFNANRTVGVWLWEGVIPLRIYHVLAIEGAIRVA